MNRWSVAEPMDHRYGPDDEEDEEAAQRDRDEEADARAESDESSRDYEDANGWEGQDK